MGQFVKNLYMRSS